MKSFSMIRYIYRLAALMPLLFIQPTGMSAAPDGLRVEWTGVDRVRIAFPLTDGRDVGGNYAVCVTPVLIGDKGDSLRLSPVIFRNKINRRYVERGRRFGTQPQALTREAAAGETITYETLLRRKDVPWLWKERVDVVLRREKDGCCNVEDLPARTITQLEYKPLFVPSIAPVAENKGRAGLLQQENPVLCHISKYKPYDNTRVLRKEEGALYVHFALDKAKLDNKFRENDATLNRIVDLTREIMTDSTSSVKIIQIIGLASVEGPRANNSRLAEARAQALKKYVQSRVQVPDSLFECVNGGEAWTELRDQIADSSFEGSEKLLGIIDGEADADRREYLMKRLDGGKPYAYLKKHILHDQRNSGYLRIYYDYVPDNAAKTINEASMLLKKEKYAEALNMLLTVKEDSRAQNALGVAYYMNGCKTEALESFRKAAADGNEQAAENLRQLEM